MRFVTGRKLTRSFQWLITCVMMCVGCTYLLVSQRSCQYTSNGSTDSPRPLVFIGGHPRSGTTLLRVMLDVHPQIRCGPETHLIPRMLNELRTLQTGSTRKRLTEANLYPGAIHLAVTAFIRALIEKAGPPAPVLCSKDPLAFSELVLLGQIFPEARFIHMVRDGRAVTASMIKRRVRMTPNQSTPQQVFQRWEAITTSILDQCLNLTSKRCLTVPYEQLVLQPERTMRFILGFLNVSWDAVVLHHERYINHTTILSRLEPSTSQIYYPVNLAALSSWAGSNSVLPVKFIHTAHHNSTLLWLLGYADSGIPPNYGQPDPGIKSRTENLLSDPQFRRIMH